MKTSYPMATVIAPGKIAFRDHTPQAVGPQDVKLRVKAVTLCGSDLHIYKGLHPAAKLPSPVGHEISGEIIEIGEKVTNLKIGDRVAVEPVLVCDECYFCRRGQYSLCTDISFQYRRGQGGITPYFVVPGKWAHKLPQGLSYAEGALMEPLSVAIHAVNQSNVELGHSSAIFGGGAIGLLLLQVLKVRGSADVFIVDIHDYRLETALQMGASTGINNLEMDALKIISKATNGLGVDRSFEAVGIETTLVQSLKVLKKGGVATLVGLFEEPSLQIPANLFVQKEITLVGSQGYCWDFQTAIQLADQKHVDLRGMITHEIPFERVKRGFELLTQPDSNAIKVAILID